MPTVWDPSSHIDVSETSFIQASPNVPELEPGRSVTEPESYESCKPSSSFGSRWRNIKKSSNTNISRKLSQGTTSKGPPQNDSKSLKVTKPSNNVTKKSKNPLKEENKSSYVNTSNSLKKEERPRTPNPPPMKDKSSPTPSKETRQSVRQRGVLEAKNITASMPTDGERRKLPNPRPSPAHKTDKKSENKKERRPKKDNTTPHSKQGTANPIEKVTFEDVVELNPAVSDRFPRQPLKIPKKSLETEKPSVNRNRKPNPPLRKGNIHPAAVPQLNPVPIPPSKPDSSSLENSEEIKNGGGKLGNALEKWKNTYKKNLLESLLRRLERKPKKVSKDEATNRRSFKSISKHTEPKVFEGIEELIKDLDAVPWASTTKQKRLDTMKRLQSYNNSLKSANETLRRLANERNIAFMKSVLAHRQSLIDAKSERIETDSSSKYSENPSLNDPNGLMDTSSIVKTKQIELLDKRNSPPKLGLTERERIILFDRNPTGSSALTSSLKKLEDSKRNVLIGKVNISTKRESPNFDLEIKEKKDDAKPEIKPKPK